MSGTVLWPGSEPTLSYRVYGVWQYYCVWCFARLSSMMTNGGGQLWDGGDWFLEFFICDQVLHASLDTEEAKRCIDRFIRLLVRFVFPDPCYFWF